MKHLQVVAAILIHDGQILGMQRGSAQQDYIAYKYEFPGGWYRQLYLRQKKIILLVCHYFKADYFQNTK